MSDTPGTLSRARLHCQTPLISTDGTTDGQVLLEVVAHPIANLALLHNGVPVIQELCVGNVGARPDPAAAHLGEPAGPGPPSGSSSPTDCASAGHHSIFHRRPNPSAVVHSLRVRVWCRDSAGV
jgi:hypothetical protein